MIRRISFWLGLVILALPLVVIGATDPVHRLEVLSGPNPSPTGTGQPSPTPDPDFYLTFGANPNGGPVGASLNVTATIPEGETVSSFNLYFETTELPSIGSNGSGTFANRPLAQGQTFSITRTFDTTSVPEGLQALRGVIILGDGREGSGNGSFTIDHTPPSCSYKYPAAGLTPPINSWVNDYRSLQVQCTDALNMVAGVRLKNPTDLNVTLPYIPMVGTNDWLYPDYDTNLVADGLLTFQTIAFDTAGNVTVPLTTPVRVDNTAPTAAFVLDPLALVLAGPGGTENVVHGVETIVLTKSDGGVGLSSTPTFKLDGVIIPNTPINTAAYSSGAHQLQVIVSDLLGNTKTVSQLLTFDNSGPVVNLLSPTEGAILPGGLSSISATYSDIHGISGSPVIRIDGKSVSYSQAPSANVFVLDAIVTTEGMHTLQFQIADTLGNVGERLVNFYIPGAGTVSQTTFITPLNGVYVHGTVALKAITTGFTIDGGQFKVNNVSFAANLTTPPGVFETTVNTVGSFSNAVTISAMPEVLGVPQTGTSISVIVDNTIPAINSFTPTGSVNGTVQIQASVSDDHEVASVEILIDNVSVATLNPPSGTASANIGYAWDTSATAFGTHLVRVNVTDRAGNTNTLSNPLTVQAASLPQITVITPHQDNFLRAIAPLRMQVAGNVLTAGFRIDGGQLIPATFVAPDQYMTNLNTTAGYTSGRHNIDFVAANSGGSVFQTVQVWFDNTPPTLAVTRPVDNQTVFAPITFKANAVDTSGQPLSSVEFRLNSSQLAFFAGNSDPSNSNYTYLFDPLATGGKFDGIRLYPDGVYTLTVIATDKAGNTTTQAVAFNINVAHPPISAATLTWSPAGPFVSGQQLVSVTVANGSFDPSYVTDETLKIFITKDGEVDKRLAGSVLLSGNTLRFSGVVPANSRVKCVLNAVSMQGELIPGTQQFIAAMVKSAGGIVTLLPEGLLRVSIPVGGLDKDALVELVKQPENQFPDLSPDSTLVTVYGPFEITAQASSNSPAVGLALPAQMIFQRSVSEIPPPQQSGFVDAAQVYESSRNIWRDLGHSGAQSLGITGNPSVRTITASINQFGVYRITSMPIPSQGISELYNAPNPFSPSEGGTNFNYLLGDNSEVNIVIYDLFGNFVRRIDIGSGAPGAATGSNMVNWDGRNGAGDEVANGGYIVQITVKDSSGHVARARRKVAVAK